MRKMIFLLCIVLIILTSSVFYLSASTKMIAPEEINEALSTNEEIVSHHMSVSQEVSTEIRENVDLKIDQETAESQNVVASPEDPACSVETDLNEEETVKSTYTEDDLNILALIIYQEAGSDIYSDETRMMVGNVFLNRVESPDFPNTFYEVATAYRQYGTLYWTGIVWPSRSEHENERVAVERAYDCAQRLLNGERVFDTNDVVWQAEFRQGREEVAFRDGISFCR